MRALTHALKILDLSIHPNQNFCSQSQAGRKADFSEENELTDGFLLETRGTGAAGWTLDAIAELAHVDLEFSDGSAQGVAVHAEFARRAALVALILLQNGKDEPLFEFPDTFRIKDVAAVHLQDECFQLILHD